ncbi:2Fe-2S iron-sulfur cluster binding domain-containing protein [Nitratireductor sp. CAU 1489]|uniref:2Fe-2S iron-sulfur cluster binding domain-containing protein n=1 Tax=Nitratireductor arenosus TaxID=2682096 RepID=A0A844QAN6_9HYPH|nr:2Fe-2S iron-sulfur cluster-binding protein [Nitratireductor arenosus]MVA96242.1 2Fe-2S iron-sulfur cluster binding domain-containing protein [Nitratireductor arenosus]
MPLVTFINSMNTSNTIDVPVGETLMRAAVNSNIDGILGECGGACCCATCHVYLDSTSAPDVPRVGEMEQQMLDHVAEPRRDDSRLACQLVVDSSMEGLRVTIPQTQL